MADEQNTEPTSDEAPFKSAADNHPSLLERLKEGAEHVLHGRPGQSFTPGLRNIEGSTAPAMADGTEVPHVMGPQQAPVDPVAAGLDTTAHPLTRAENRVITRTGALGAGNPPSTYAEKGATPAEAPSDMSEVAAPADAESDAQPGPNSAAQPSA